VVTAFGADWAVDGSDMTVEPMTASAKAAIRSAAESMRIGRSSLQLRWRGVTALVSDVTARNLQVAVARIERSEMRERAR